MTAASGIKKPPHENTSARGATSPTAAADHGEKMPKVSQDQILAVQAFAFKWFLMTEKRTFVKFATLGLLGKNAPLCWQEAPPFLKERAFDLAGFLDAKRPVRKDVQIVTVINDQYLFRACKGWLEEHDAWAAIRQKFLESHPPEQQV